MPPLLFATMLAHQGGWDEALWVMIPAVAVAYVLRIARLRAEDGLNRSDDGRECPEGVSEPSSSSDDVDTDL